MSLSQRRVINIFKSFIEKVFIPHLSKLDSICQQEWNKFNVMISNDQININQIQQYIDKIPNQLLGIGKYQYQKNVESKLLTSSHRIKKDATFDGNGNISNNANNANFNPNKTFGGEKARMMFPMKDIQELNALEHKSPTYFSNNNNNNHNVSNDSTSNSRDFLKEKEDLSSNGNQMTTQTVLPILQKLFKVFSDNQLKLQKIGSAQSAIQKIGSISLPNASEYRNFY